MINWFNKARQGLMDEVNKFKNKDFMEAVVASCALVAAADGVVSSEEKQKMIKFIKLSDELKVFKLDDVIASWQKIIEKFDFDADLGRSEALKIIGRINSNSEAARTLIRVSCAIGCSDGDFSNNEKQVIRQIGVELGLDPSELGL